MTYCFEHFELDPERFELRANGQVRHVEPQVLSILLLLAENGDRMISKDELVDRIWDGRIISEAAIAARIKAARKAIEDDGSAQRLIKTIHGKGFRFVGTVNQRMVSPPSAPIILHAVEEPPPPPIAEPANRGRPSIAILPFTLLGERGPHDIIADALPAEIIMDLSRIHWLFVIARGSSFRLRGADGDILAAGRTLGVRYCLTGSVEKLGHEVVVDAMLSETGQGGVIWAERFRGSASTLQQVRLEVASQIVSRLSEHIPQHEVQIARGRPIAELDAWSAFHLGLDRMYRFNSADNAEAARFFGRALECDSEFASALAGLSFTHFQNAFLRYEGDGAEEAEKARILANKAVECDRMDPFSNFNLARSFWLDGRLADSIEWFDRTTTISPNYAQGVYNRGLVSTLAGDADKGDRDLEMALELSPIDPLRYAMLSSRALTHLQFGKREEAALFGERAALTPGAHKHIQLIAALTAHLIGDEEKAQLWLGRTLKTDPGYNAESFLHVFPYAQTEARETITRGLRELGL